MSDVTAGPDYPVMNLDGPPALPPDYRDVVTDDVGQRIAVLREARDILVGSLGASNVDELLRVANWLMGVEYEEAEM